MKNNRNLTIIVVIGILIFFTGLFLYYLNRSGFFSHQSEQKNGVVNMTITFEQPKLKIFDDLYFLNEFPDRIRIHHPYVLIVIPENYKQVTTVYDTKKKAKVATLNDIALDYDNGNFLYNKNGLITYYNKQSLGLHCSEGFIKSSIEILCVTPKASDPIDNKLISINPQTLVKHDIYSSQNHLGAINVINGSLYIAEVNISTKKTYLTVNNKSFEMPAPVDIIYSIGQNTYFATLKRSEQKQEVKYFLIEKKGNEFVAKLQEKGKILFYKE